MLSCTAPADPARNSRIHAAIRSGGSSTTPAAPIPPASATATARAGGQAPSIGAATIGSRSPNRSQKLRALESAVIVVPSQLHVMITVGSVA